MITQEQLKEFKRLKALKKKYEEMQAYMKAAFLRGDKVQKGRYVPSTSISDREATAWKQEFERIASEEEVEEIKANAKRVPTFSLEVIDSENP